MPRISSAIARSALIPFLLTTSLNAAPAQPKGKAFNPDISANFLGLLQRSTGVSDDRTQSPHDGLSLQEAEVQFTSDVDPYFRAVALLSVAQKGGTAEFGIDPEEVYLETISLPSITFKAGKFKTALGKHNQLHTHAFPFVDQPLINKILLGDEGLNEPGVSASVLLPTGWYSEIVGQAISLSNDALYKSVSARQVGGVGHLKNLFDLSDDLTMEAGLSGTAGKNQFGNTSSVFGADLTFKWRPSVGGKYQALIWSTEYLQGNRVGMVDAASGSSTSKLGGLATWVQYQMAERWWVEGRYEYVGVARSSVALPIQNRQSVLVGFFPSEFSGFRLQYDHTMTEGKDKADHTIALQYNISIGAHPAHAY